MFNYFDVRSFFILGSWLLVAIVAIRGMSWLEKYTGSPEYKGKAGEKKVSALHHRQLDKSVYRIIDDVTIEWPDKKGTSQIDHLIFSRYGIFVIETKNYSFLMEGQREHRKWAIIRGRYRKFIDNPFQQNIGHMKTLLAKYHIPFSLMHSIVVFSGKGRFIHRVPPGASYLSTYIRDIRKHDRVLLTDEEVEAIYKRVLNDRMTPGKDTDRIHLKNIARNYGKS